MAMKVILNDTLIQTFEYEQEQIQNQNGQVLWKIRFAFKVKSEEYHDIATLLYKKIFDVTVPENGLAFRGAIQNYSTSLTNLYQKGQVADYRLELMEIEPTKKEN
ncbi:DUF3219 family protein [Heyndrickxia acidiproducens]|uniref:DUF3219 family protein n=1 Tax=Heyndrickxia acidiproducens TaxID=1121084 RepID=UPI00037A6326|nr:DUF3219 family protein [Heyndrickxia acidiproducens]